MEEQKFGWSMREEDAVRFLKEALPVSDRITVDERAIIEVARHALAVREIVPWGKRIPEDLFKAYVLFPRVNNEFPVVYHARIWNQLRDRVQGMRMREAVLEINYWCCENAAYQSTDERTLDALSVLRRGFGRCGEESTLLVSALRTAGIPARQVYVPRWSHCDDNHAWVEAWADGAWHYLGACEPEPRLDSGWFTASASKAMLIHTWAFGVCLQGERIEKEAGGVYEINRTAFYADTTFLRVRVTDGGKPSAGVGVRFEIANGSEFFPIIEKETDGNGNVDLLVGLGTLRIHAYRQDRCVGRMVDTRCETECALELPQTAARTEIAVSFKQRPPAETRIQPTDYPSDVLQTHELRLKRCDKLRTAKVSAFPSEGFLHDARGNAEEIEAFLSMVEFSDADKALLLETLRPKDFVDADQDMLADMLRCALRYRRDYPFDVWKESLLCPRITHEKLTAHREYLRSCLTSVVSPEPLALWAHLKESVQIIEDQPPLLIPDFRAVYEKKRCPESAFRLFFIACARSLGIAARLDRKSGLIEVYRNGTYTRYFSSKADSACLCLHGEDGHELVYGVNYTVAERAEGVYRTLFPEKIAPDSTVELSLSPGSYRIMVCTRQIDGTVDGKLIPVDLKAGQLAACRIDFPPEQIEDKLINARLSDLLEIPCGSEKTAVSIFETLGGRNGIVACIAPGNEPTEHFLNELLESEQAIREKEPPIRLLLRKPEELHDEKLQKVLAAFENVEVFFTKQPEVLLQWHRLMNAGDIRLPFACAVRANGEGIFAFANYSVGSVRALLRILEIAH